MIVIPVKTGIHCPIIYELISNSYAINTYYFYLMFFLLHLKLLTGRFVYYARFQGNNFRARKSDKRNSARHGSFVLYSLDISFLFPPNPIANVNTKAAAASI